MEDAVSGQGYSRNAEREEGVKVMRVGDRVWASGLRHEAGGKGCQGTGLWWSETEEEGKRRQEPSGI